jgi:hypothetical protein
MAASVRFWSKSTHDFRIQVPEPIRPFALSYLAASGMFDRIVIERSDGVVIEAAGADLIRCADQVCVAQKAD